MLLSLLQRALELDVWKENSRLVTSPNQDLGF